jgi:hypothetical protein
MVVKEQFRPVVAGTAIVEVMLVHRLLEKQRVIFI